MDLQEFLDSIPLLVYLLFAIIILILPIKIGYRGASLLNEKWTYEAKELLRQLVQLRRDSSDAEDRDEFEEVIELVRDVERLHDRLWQVADRSMQSPGDSIDDSIFSNAIMEIIRANDERLQHTMFNRISPIIWITLLAMSVLSMIIMGYQAGLTGKRSFLAT